MSTSDNISKSTEGGAKTLGDMAKGIHGIGETM